MPCLDGQIRETQFVKRSRASVQTVFSAPTMSRSSIVPVSVEVSNVYQTNSAIGVAPSS